MEENIRTRKRIFEKILTLEGTDNKKNWEMLCSSEKSLVPFIGAGISAWCYPTWDSLLKGIVEEFFSKKCADVVSDALNCRENPDVKNQSDFHWMEEIAECIFEENSSKYNENMKKYELVNVESKEAADINLKRLRDYIGNEGVNKKRAARGALNHRFDDALIKTQKIPEYQRYFPILFPHILVTTNYDNALSACYTSKLSYSHMDLNKGDDKSWLFKAVSEKLKAMNGKEAGLPSVTVPDMPMLLKVHGSIERADEIALTRSGYEKVYMGEMPELLEKIFRESTLLFLGYSLREDRVMDVLNKVKKGSKSIRHFAFLPAGHRDKTRSENLTEAYGIYPIYYDEKLLEEIIFDEEERRHMHHDYFLGLLLENLARRKKGYLQPSELLWEKNRYREKKQLTRMQMKRKRMWEQSEEQFVRHKEALQIWRVLNFSEECPLIAVTGPHGSGKSTLCRSIQELQKGYSSTTMQFFFIGLAHCKSWDEFCVQVFQELNITELETPGIDKWREFAEKVADRCGVYWRCALILDCVDNLKVNPKSPETWETLKKVLKYWKEHKTRVIFSCRTYPDGVPCYTWSLGELGKEDAKKVFFTACISGQNRDITYLEQKVVGELFARQTFQPSSIDLLGKYANSKSDLTSLLEEWNLYQIPGDSGEQTLARVLWNHLLDEHHYEEQNDAAQKDIRDNLLWLWGILGNYPGKFPIQFFKVFFNTKQEETYKEKSLTKKSIMYMKNIGLCEETGNERQNILLENMIDCVNDYFSEISKDPAHKGLKIIADEFQKEIGKLEKKGLGVEHFRGYVMSEWEEDLRKYVWRELEENKNLSDENKRIEEKIQKEKSQREILRMLKIIGKVIKDDKQRKKHPKLNQILHYEIGTVIRFLCICLWQWEEDENTLKEIIEIAYYFSHHYHYMPSHAYPLVLQLITIMEGKERKYNVGELYQLAELKRVMGDIQRLSGKKDEALRYYRESAKLCHEQIIYTLEQENGKTAYEEYARIYARVTLISTYYDEDLCAGNLDEGDDEERLQETLCIYESLDDTWGKAYYNQRMGELMNRFGKSGKKKFVEIRKYYEEAGRLYESIGDKTGTAYIWKSLGDLNTEYMKYSGSDERWFVEAVRCYKEAFLLYCNNINWRGLANVLQAMETCCREAKIYNIRLVKNVYGLAEECYRWLGDIRGLADTLDYSGYGHRESEDEADKFIALSLWMESRQMWKRQGNVEKAELIGRKIKKLQKKLYGDKKKK